MTVTSSVESLVTDAVIREYEENGVVMVPQPFAMHWIDAIHEAVLRNLRDDAEKGESNCMVTAAQGRARIFNLAAREPAVRRWALESSAAEIVARLMGSKTSRYYFDVAFCKMGGGETGKGSRTGYHVDVSAFGFKGRMLPSFWTALTDVDEDNGPIVTAIGSHKKVKHLYRSVYTNMPVIDGYKDNSEIYNFLAEHDFELKVWPCKRGDVLIFNPYLVHASMPMKRLDGERYGFSSRWMGDDVRWTPNVYTAIEEGVQPYTLAPGAPPPDDWYPKFWDSEEGYIARNTGAFSPFISMEPKAGYHKLEPGYKVPDMEHVQ